MAHMIANVTAGSKSVAAVATKRWDMVKQGLQITANLRIDASDLSEQFVLASGPGGQNVNKLATAVQLRFDLAHSSSLAAPVKSRLLALAGRRASRDGVIVISADRFRSQERNREDARARLKALIIEAMKPPPPKRKKTRPSRSANERRLKQKAGRAVIKRLRSRYEQD